MDPSNKKFKPDPAADHDDGPPTDTNGITTTLESFGNDVLMDVASYLDARGMAHLSFTCRKFGGARLDQDAPALPLMEEAARRAITGTQTDHERAALPRYEGEPWIALLSHLEALRSPLAFDQLLGGDIERVGPNSVWSQEWDTNTAICDTVMRAGRHYATFSKEGFGRMNAGIMRPAKGLDRGGYVQFDPLERSCWSPLLERRNERWGGNDVNCCMYYSTYGTCSWSDWQTETTHGHAWGGSQILLGNGEIGMLLDLDAGSLSVFMDGRRLGTMMEGLSGEYCWAASVWSGTKLTIKRECAPADR